MEVEIENPSTDDIEVLIDLRVHFVKAKGATSPKVFKGAEWKHTPGARVRDPLNGCVVRQETYEPTGAILRRRPHSAGTYVLDR